MDQLISQEFLDNLKEHWKREYGEELSDEAALDQGLRLLNLFRAIYRPIPRDRADLYFEIERWYKENT